MAVQISEENPHRLVGYVAFVKNLLCSLVVFYVQQSFTAFSAIFFSQVLASRCPGWMPSMYNQKLLVFRFRNFSFFLPFAVFQLIKRSVLKFGECVWLVSLICLIFPFRLYTWVSSFLSCFINMCNTFQLYRRSKFY